MGNLNLSQLNNISIQIWVLTGIVLICLIILVIGLIMICAHRVQIRKLHRITDKRLSNFRDQFTEVHTKLNEKVTLQTRILANLRLIKEQNINNNKNHSESHGGNMKGGNQTVHINVPEPTPKPKTAQEFQAVLFEQMSDAQRLRDIEIERLKEEKEEQELIIAKLKNKLKQNSSPPLD